VMPVVEVSSVPVLVACLALNGDGGRFIDG
jgi:hypothetical protein